MEGTHSQVVPRPTVLVVDDETVLLEVVRELLADEGFRVLTASSGDAALTMTQTYDGPIHVLLTDVRMPGMTGFELAHAMRRNRPETSVLYMSGEFGNAARRTRIGKPFCPSDLVDAVASAANVSNRRTAVAR